MSPMSGPAAAGDAHELPKGRLTAFEDDDALDLGSLITRRTPASRTPSSRDLPDRASQAEEGEDQPPLSRREPTRQAPRSPSPPTASDQSPERVAAPDAEPAGPDLPDAAFEQPTPPPETPRHARRTPIRSSSVHIPVALLDKLAEEKQRNGRSNGEIVIVAIEHCHDRLGELLGRHAPTGGSVFERRASRGARLADGPLTALNVRLFEQDYSILDQLVAEHGAFSRGHLITTALTAYFNDQDPARSRPDRGR